RVVARLVPAQVDRGELVEGELAVGLRVALRPVGDDQLLLGVGLRPERSGREGPARRGHRPGERRADPEPAAERLAHVPDLLQVAPDEAVAHELVVTGERTRAAGHLTGLQG